MKDPIDNARERASSPLEWLRAMAPRLIAGLALAVVATAAGVISYTHIDALTLALGGSTMAGRLMPFGVDGQIVVGSIVLLTATGRLAYWGWLGIGLGMAESLAANWESGIAHGVLAAGWSAVPALSFAVASFMFERWLSAQVSQSRPGGRSGQPEQVTEPVPEPEPVIEYVTVEVPVEVPVSCGHEHPATVDEAVAAAFLHARDCEHEPLSQRELAKRFDRSRAKVAELVAPHLDEAQRRVSDREASDAEPATPEPVAASLNGSGPHA